MNKSRGLSPCERTCMQRIRNLIETHCGGSQQRFVERTGLNKGSVSQYVSGKNTPSVANAERIASAFNVDAAWVMGYDFIPPVKTNDKQAICDAFLKVIQMTAAGDDITALRYDAKTEIVHVDTECNRDIRQINVALDSGWAMIQDIVNNIHIG